MESSWKWLWYCKHLAINEFVLSHVAKKVKHCKASVRLSTLSADLYLEFDEFLSDRMDDTYTLFWGRGPTQLID
jgi:hypothetical protein